MSSTECLLQMIICVSRRPCEALYLAVNFEGQGNLLETTMSGIDAGAQCAGLPYATLLAPTASHMSWHLCVYTLGFIRLVSLLVSRRSKISVTCTNREQRPTTTSPAIALLASTSQGRPKMLPNTMIADFVGPANFAQCKRFKQGICRSISTPSKTSLTFQPRVNIGTHAVQNHSLQRFCKARSVAILAEAILAQGSRNTFQGCPYLPTREAFCGPCCLETAVHALLTGGAVRLAQGAVPALALLPPTCKQAAAHAALVCSMGAEPAYYAAGLDLGRWPGGGLRWVLLGAALAGSRYPRPPVARTIDSKGPHLIDVDGTILSIAF